MDLWKIEKITESGYFIEQIDHENAVILLSENCETGVLSNERRKFWYSLAEELKNEQVALTISRNCGLCPRCRNHFVFEDVSLAAIVEKLELVLLPVGKKITNPRVEPYLKFSIDVNYSDFKKMQEHLDLFGCEINELVTYSTDFPGAKTLLTVGLYIPIKVISQVRLEI